MCMQGSCVRTECNPDPLQKFDTQIKKSGNTSVEYDVQNCKGDVIRISTLGTVLLQRVGVYSAEADKEQTLQDPFLEAIFAPLFAPAFEWRRNVCRNFEPFCAQKKPAEANKDGWGGRPKQQEMFLPLGVLCETMESGSSSSSCSCLWLHFLCLFSFSLWLRGASQWHRVGPSSWDGFCQMI